MHFLYKNFLLFLVVSFYIPLVAMEEQEEEIPKNLRSDYQMLRNVKEVLNSEDDERVIQYWQEIENDILLSLPTLVTDQNRKEYTEKYTTILLGLLNCNNNVLEHANLPDVYANSLQRSNEVLKFAISILESEEPTKKTDILFTHYGLTIMNKALLGMNIRLRDIVKYEEISKEYFKNTLGYLGLLALFNYELNIPFGSLPADHIWFIKNHLEHKLNSKSQEDMNRRQQKKIFFIAMSLPKKVDAVWWKFQRKKKVSNVELDIYKIIKTAHNELLQLNSKIKRRVDHGDYNRYLCALGSLVVLKNETKIISFFYKS